MEHNDFAGSELGEALKKGVVAPSPLRFAWSADGWGCGGVVEKWRGATAPFLGAWPYKKASGNPEALRVIF